MKAPYHAASANKGVLLHDQSQALPKLFQKGSHKYTPKRQGLCPEVEEEDVTSFFRTQ